MWVWRDETVSGTDGGGWRLDASGTWTWDAARVPGARERVLSRGGDRAIAAIGTPAPARPVEYPRPVEHARPPEYTPIFNAVAEDRWVGARVPEPHPGSGPLPVQDPHRGAPRAMGPVPTVPPPAAEALDAASPEDELRRRAERRRRPRAVEPTPGAAGGRHTLTREEPREGRHTLRR